MIVKIYLINNIQFSYVFIKALWGVPGPHGPPSGCATGLFKVILDKYRTVFS